MIEEALDADSRDNITCVVFDLAAAEAQPTKELLAVNPCGLKGCNWVSPG